MTSEINRELPRWMRLGGEARLMANSNWSNFGWSFDVARFTLYGGDLKVDRSAGWSRKSAQWESIALHPVRTSTALTGEFVPGATLESYFLWRLEHGYESESASRGHLDLKTLGCRFVRKTLSRFDYAFDYSRQLGSSAGRDSGLADPCARRVNAEPKALSYSLL